SPDGRLGSCQQGRRRGVSDEAPALRRPLRRPDGCCRRTHHQDQAPAGRRRSRRVTSRPFAVGHGSRGLALRLPLWMSFVAASLSFVAVFAASASPIPLYELYHRTSSVTKTDLSLTAVAYFVAAVTALHVFGRLSNHLGR